MADRALGERRGFAAKAFDGHEALGGVDQFFQVLHTVLTFALGAVVLHQTAVVKHQAHDIAQVQARGLFAQHVHLGHKAADGCARAPAHAADGVPQGTPRSAGHVLQLLHAARANAARREVDHAHEAGVVVGVFEQAQIGQGVFDFGALKKAQAAVHAVSDAGVEERGFHHPALGVAAVEHGDFLVVHALAVQLADFVDHPLRLGVVAGGLEHPHRLARARVGAQVFAQTLAVVRNQVVGRVQDVAAAAVVLLELDLVLHTELANEVGHVAHARAAEGVNALVVIAHGKQGVGAVPVLRQRAQELEPGVLQLVGVLKLIDQDVAKAALVVLAHGGVVAQHLVAAQHQLTKVHHALALALRFVQGVELDFFARFFVARHHIGRAQTVFFAAADEVLHLLGRVTVGVDVVLLAQALDGRELVLGVQDLKGLGQTGQHVVGAQKPVAQAVEGADPHATHIDRQHGREARHHFFGGLVGEGHRQHASRPDLPGLQQPRDAGRQHPRFARASTSQNQCRLGR